MAQEETGTDRCGTRNPRATTSKRPAPAASRRAASRARDPAPDRLVSTPTVVASFTSSPHARDTCPVPAGCLEIGFLNNMPDAALVPSERRFTELLSVAAGHAPVRMHLFCLPDIPRGDTARDHLRLHYADVAELSRTSLDALIVTGSEPRAAALDDEPYWRSLASVICWARENTTSTIFSCLAAHAAVLRLDGIKRRPLETKRSGVYRCLPVNDHPLLAGVDSSIAVPHSRWNDLAEAELVAHGYSVLTRAEGAGVDMFVKEWKSLFVFFQGHPEYQVDALQREYRRDVGRFLRGDAATYPSLPIGYFSRASEAELTLLQMRASTQRPDVILAGVAQAMQVRPQLVRQWGRSVVPLLRNWMNYLVARKVSKRS